MRWKGKANIWKLSTCPITANTIWHALTSRVQTFGGWLYSISYACAVWGGGLMGSWIVAVYSYTTAITIRHTASLDERSGLQPPKALLWVMNQYSPSSSWQEPVPVKANRTLKLHAKAKWNLSNHLSPTLQEGMLPMLFWRTDHTPNSTSCASWLVPLTSCKCSWWKLHVCVCTCLILWVELHW